MAQGQKIVYTLSFDADTEKAKKQLNDLKNQLSSIAITTPILGKNGNISTELEQGVDAAKHLRMALESATNVSTNKLDVAQFVKSLSNYNLNLQQCATHLHNIGQDDAMAKLCKQIIEASDDTNILTEKFSKFFSGLKNTAM